MIFGNVDKSCFWLYRWLFFALFTKTQNLKSKTEKKKGDILVFSFIGRNWDWMYKYGWFFIDCWTKLIKILLFYPFLCQFPLFHPHLQLEHRNMHEFMHTIKERREKCVGTLRKAGWTNNSRRYHLLSGC